MKSTSTFELSDHMTPPKRKNIISSQVFGTLVFVLTEIMFFTALVSAFLVIKGSRESFAVPLGVRLPILATAFNTLVLIFSGFFLFRAGQLLAKGRDLQKVRALILRSIMFGFFFLAIQGFEWVQLISFGLGMKSSIFGACFFLLIGSHALHVFGGVLALIYVYRCKPLDPETLKAVQVFWYFVVGVWPILYGLVYF